MCCTARSCDGQVRELRSGTRKKKKNGAMLMMRLQAVQKDEARLKVVITCRAR